MNSRKKFGAAKFSKVFLGIFILVCCVVLQGCVSVAITGVKMAYDHTSIQKKISDYYIVAQAKQNLHSDPALMHECVDVTAFQGIVLLTGQVSTEALRQQVVNNIRQINGIIHIYNFLTVGEPISMAVRSQDTWITTKVKTKIIASNSLVPYKIKVVTENGVVYLMAILTHEEADMVVDIAANTDGVRQVVKMFYYIIMPTLS